MRKLNLALENHYGITIPNPNEILGTPDRCRQLLRSAGFLDIEIIIEQVGTFLGDGEGAWCGNANSAFGLQNVGWSPEKLEQCKQEYLAELGKRSTEAGYWNNVEAFFAIAHV